MLTRQHKIGLALAFLLGLTDVAILAAAGDDSSDRPPTAIIATGVVIGLATLVLVALAWRRPTRPLIIAIVALRAVSALGDLAALGESAAVVTVSMVLLVLSVACIVLLRDRLRRPAPADTRERVG